MSIEQLSWTNLTTREGSIFGSGLYNSRKSQQIEIKELATRSAEDSVPLSHRDADILIHAGY